MAEECNYDEMFPPTQPVLPLVLRDVVAFVEVRSGNDNRTMGVQSEMRTLGARVESTLNDKVTHVVFQGGQVCTYRKARKMMCHVVSVSWIEASKHLGHKAPEEEYPPPGVEKYEDPDAARKIRVMKSMQPHFNDDKEEERLNAILSRIKRKNNGQTDSESDVCSANRKRGCRQANGKRKAGAGSSRRPSETSTGNPTPHLSEENPSRQKRNIASVSRKPNCSSHSESQPKRARGSRIKTKTAVPPCDKTKLDEIEEDTGKIANLHSSNMAEGYRRNFNTVTVPEDDPSQSRTMENRPFKSKLSLRGYPGDRNVLQPNNLAVPSATNPKTASNGLKTPNPAIKPNDFDLRNNTGPNFPACLRNSRENAENAALQEEIRNCDQIMSKTPAPSLPLRGTKAAPTRALASIGNIISETRRKSERFHSRGKSSLQSPEPMTPARRCTGRNISGENEIQSCFFVDPSHMFLPEVTRHHMTSSSKKFKLALTEGNPFVNSVLLSLSKKKPQTLYPKSPWRRVKHSDTSNETYRRRQSPRLNVPKRKTEEEDDVDLNVARSDSEDSRDSLRAHWGSPPKKRPVPLRRGVVNDRASAHMIKSWRAKSCFLDSPNSDTIDKGITDEVITSPIHLYKINPAERYVCPEKVSDSEKGQKHSIPVENNQDAGFDELENDRSESPILGTCVKRCMFQSLMKANVSNKSLHDDSPVQISTIQREEKLQRERPCSLERVECPVDIEENAPQKGTADKLEGVHEDDNLSTKASVGSNESCETKQDEDVSSKRRSTRRRSQPKQLYLVCTHMKSSEVKQVEKAVSFLGSFTMENKVSSRTTHLVSNGPRRTINMLRAISRGCWILKADWVFQSRKSGKWLDESEFELDGFSPLVKLRRLQRQSSDDAAQCKWNLFSSVGRIFVSPSSQPPASDLKELITLNGGSVTNSGKDADLIVGPTVKKTTKVVDKKPRVLPVWLLDCITKGELLSTSSPSYMA